MKLEEALIQEEKDYLEFLKWAEFYEENRLDEFALPAAIKSKVDFIKKLATDTKFKFLDLVKLFKNKTIFQFFSRIKFSFVELHKLLKKGFQAYHFVLDAISDYVAKSGAGRWTEEKLKKLDSFLQKHPKMKRVAGIGVAALLVYIWFNMTFTGDPQFDFDMTDLLAALAGKFSLSNIFAGTNGTKLLLLFATGVIGLSFPWPGPSKIQFVVGIVQTLAQKARVRLQKSNNPVQEL